MGFLIDSSIWVAGERRQIDLPELFNRYPGEPLAISAVTASELLHEVQRAQGGKRAQQRNAFVEYVVSGYTIVPFDLGAARQHAKIWAMLQAGGAIIGAHDLLIAATALAIDYSVLTLNTAEFSRVPGLRVIGPDAPGDADRL